MSMFSLYISIQFVLLFVDNLHFSVGFASRVTSTCVGVQLLVYRCLVSCLSVFSLLSIGVQLVVYRRSELVSMFLHHSMFGVI